jgi:DNA polymerase/3'-5' exonuclease PolX
VGDRKYEEPPDLFGRHVREFPRRPWAGASLIVARLTAELHEAGLRVGGPPDVADAWWAGSYRRDAPTVGDLDLVVRSDAVDRLPPSVARPREGLVQWSADVDCLDDTWIQVDVWSARPGAVGPMLVFATGPGRLNIVMRAKAKGRGLLLNQHGAWRGAERLDDGTEEGVFAAVGMEYRTPVERQARYA